MLKLKQPPAFNPLMATQLFEHVGFSFIHALLVFYLIEFKGFPDWRAYNIVSTFTALFFTGTVIGGYITDRFINHRLSLFLGLSLQISGYLLAATPHIQSLHVSLVMIIIGSALFKPTINSFLSLFYYRSDARRFSGFTLSYMIIQISILIATLLAGVIQRIYGWHIIFYGAALITTFSIITLYRGRIYYENRGRSTTRKPIREYQTLFVLIVWSIVIYVLLDYPKASDMVLSCVAIIVLTMLCLRTMEEQSEKRNRLAFLTILMISSILFWGICQQEYLTINLFIKRSVMRQFDHMNIPTIDFFALNALFAIIACPIISKLWYRRYRRRSMPSPILIIALSLLLLSIGMAMLSLSTHFNTSTGKVHPLWVIASIIPISLSEAILAPLCLSLITLLSPKKHMSFMVGIWLMTIGIGGTLAGIIAREANISKVNLIYPTTVRHIYAHAFLHYSLLALAGAFVLALLQPLLQRKIPINIY